MRGGFLHNDMAKRLAVAAGQRNYGVFRERPILPGQRPPSIDLVIHANDLLHLVECEKESIARVGNDIAKAEHTKGDSLSIVVPTARMRARVESALNRLGHNRRNGHLPIQVLTLGAALKWIANGCPLPPRSATRAERKSTKHRHANNER